MTLISRSVNVECYIDGNYVSNVIAVRWSAGFDIRTAQAEVDVATLPPGDFWSDIEIRTGATPEGESPNVSTRFRGFIFEYNYALYPRQVTLVCRGLLILLDNVPPAVDLPAPTDPDDLDGVRMGGMTDGAQVRFILDAVGLGGQYSSGDVGGTGHVLGVEDLTPAAGPDPSAPLPAADANPIVAPTKDTAGSGSAFVWKYGQTGGSYVEALEAVTLGFRLFERVGGEIVRWQISPRPSADTITGERLFVEGQDIEKGSSTHSIKEAKNRCRVSGHDNGTGKTFATASAGHPHSPPGLEYVSDDFSSPLIEKSEPGDPGTGLSCREVAQWRLAELNHVQLSVDFTTPRDVQISPGDTIGVSASDRLDVAQNFWVLHVDGEVSSDGTFSQTLKCRAPAAAGAGGSPYGVGGIGF